MAFYLKDSLPTIVYIVLPSSHNSSAMPTLRLKYYSTEEISIALSKLIDLRTTGGQGGKEVNELIDEGKSRKRYRGEEM